METVFAWLLVAQIFIAPHHPQNKTFQVPMPDLKTCLEEADKFLDHYEPAGEGSHVAAGCVKHAVREGKS